MRYISPSCRRAASDIMLWSHGGSSTTSTSASRDAGDREQLLLDVLAQEVAHAAAGRGERQLDAHLARRRRRGVDLAAVDEAEVHDVDRDLGVVAGLELLPGQLLASCLPGGVLGGRAARVGALADRVGVLALDAHQVAVVGHDRVGAAERLRDEDGRARRERDPVAVRDRDHLDVAATACAPRASPWSSLRACALAAAVERGLQRVPGQRRALDAHRELAHAREHRQLAELRRDLGRAARAGVTSAWKRSKSASTSATRLALAAPRSSSRPRPSRSRSPRPRS